MVLVDSNVPMYILGDNHEFRSRTNSLLQGLVARRTRLVTDAEVFQEILRRYRSIQRLDKVQPAYDLLNGIVEEVFAVDLAIAEAAKELVLAYPALSARDAVHVAIMRANDIDEILTFDRGFDAIPGVTRIPG